MRVERGLKRRDQLLKLVKRQAREIQELHRAGLQLGEPYTCHGSCLLSLYGDVRGVSYQKESGINSIEADARHGTHTAFEVKFVGTGNDDFARILESLAGHPAGGPVSPYDAINYLVFRVYE